jgi:hypothetical protein
MDRGDGFCKMNELSAICMCIAVCPALRFDNESDRVLCYCGAC